MIRIGAMRRQARAACRPLSPAGGYALRAAVTVAIVLVVTAVFWPPASARANVSSAMPDFYAEPGLHPFRDQLADTANEFIDPFSGSLQLSYVDLVVPGNGGLDIKIQRHYTSNIYLTRPNLFSSPPIPSVLLPRTPTGVGWTIHFGRVIKSTQGQFGACDTNRTNPNDDTLDNAVLELPDGSNQILFVNATSFNALFITKEQWVAYCHGASKGLLVISPDGTQYTMDHRETLLAAYDGSFDLAWYTTRIEDRNGNFIKIDYDTANLSGRGAIVKRITSSDGRTVNFSYADRTTPTKARLSTISANGQTWRYDYTPISGSASVHYQLTRVRRPDGLSWRYAYHPPSSRQPGRNALKTVTYPYGATVTYGYDFVDFAGNTLTNLDKYLSLVVKSKRIGGRDVTSGTWGFSYSPSTREDVTTVTFPGGRHEYTHFGSREIMSGSTIPGQKLWKMGLLKEKRTYNGGAVVNREIYTWDESAPYQISRETFVRPPYSRADRAVFAPVLLEQKIMRDGTTYSTKYRNFDAHFNPRTIIESGQATRTTSLTYFPRVSRQNIVSLVEDESIGSGNSRKISRTFDAKANLTQRVQYGVKEDYTYQTTGDLRTRKNARSKTWTYSNYERGIARNVSEPEGITITRVVNATGTIASETNGRRKRTSYTYDGMNRPTSIRPPTGTAISIGWSSTGRTVRRGSYTQTTTVDGFGRPSLINTAGVTKNINYNALGHTSFESYLSSGAGTTFTTDALGRVTNTRHGDGSSRRLSYRAGNQVTITNERRETTTLSYRSFGHPDDANDKVLMRIDAPEGVNTVITRNILGQLESVTQGGIPRSYGYNSSNFL
ncbi:MAG: RHS repeat protein, partial [Proteobacteria bacterium]|nr:RHS repeat protein [Pseudomonadota bacterium]